MQDEGKLIHTLLPGSVVGDGPEDERIAAVNDRWEMGHSPVPGNVSHSPDDEGVAVVHDPVSDGAKADAYPAGLNSLIC